MSHASYIKFPLVGFMGFQPSPSYTRPLFVHGARPASLSAFRQAVAASGTLPLLITLRVPLDPSPSSNAQGYSTGLPRWRPSLNGFPPAQPVSPCLWLLLPSWLWSSFATWETRSLPRLVLHLWKEENKLFHQGDPGLRLYQVLCIPHTHGRTIEHLPLAKIPFLLTTQSSPGEGKCFLRSSLGGIYVVGEK